MIESGGAPRLQGAQLVIGGQRSLDAMVEIADSATSTLEVDMFGGGHREAVHGLTRRRAGVDALFLADPELSERVRSKINKSGAQLVDTGALPAKNHAKSVVSDGKRAFVTTAALATKTPLRYEVGVRFGGDAAAALSDLSRVTASGDTAAIQAAAGRARAVGVVVNDPQHGVWHLSEEVRGLVTGAKDRLIIATKRLEEPGMLGLIEDARKRGVAVATARQLNDVGVPLHANVVIADNAAYVGSGHLTKRVLTGGGTNGRISRELGVMLEDATLVDDLARSLEGTGFIGKLDRQGMPVVAKRFPTVKVGLGAAGGLGVLAGAALLMKARGGESS